MIKILLYSHSSYFDCLDICVHQLTKYGINNFVILADKPYKDYETITYDDALSYTERLLNCLKSINDEFFIFLHEDFILYDTPKLKDLHEINYKEFDSVRLMRSGVSNVETKIADNLYKITSDADYHFAVQATIFRKSYFKTILENNIKLNIWQLESTCQGLAKTYYNVIYWDNKNLRGSCHYDSTIFPCTATAINKGKWSLEYYGELKSLHEELKIDSNIRGWV